MLPPAPEKPVYSQAATNDTHSQDSTANMSMDMSDGTQEADMPEMTTDDAMKNDISAATEGSHDQGEAEATDGHGESDPGVNWPIISTFAGINGLHC